jgi:transposase
MMSSMTTPWTASQLEHARLCAINLFCEGETPAEIAPLLGVSVRSVQRWVSAWLSGGADALAAKPRSGRPAKLTDRQAAQVLSWVADGNPTDFGFATERWTAPRVAALIEQRLGVRMNARYLNDWLRRRGRITPQVPERRAYERDEAQIREWIAHRWPRVKKRLVSDTRRWRLLMKAAFCSCRWSRRRWPRAAARPCCTIAPATATRSRPLRH